MAKWIEKQYQTSPLGAVVEDSMTSGSTVNAPSISAVTNAISNPNLIINGDFQVCQRGYSFSNIANAYTADRWLIKNAKGNTSLIERNVNVPSGQPMQYSLHIKETLTENSYLRYMFEDTIKGTYTLSFWYKSTVDFNSYVYDNNIWVHLGKNFASSTWKKVTLTFTATSVTQLSIIHAMSAGDIYIAGVKLEVGSIATPFVPRTYAEELAMCQRYTYLYAPVDYTAFDYFYNTTSTSTTTIGVPLTVEMRATPTILYKNGTIQRLANKNSQQTANATAIAVDIANNQTFKLKLTFGTNMPTSSYMEFYPINSFKILLDAEIY